MKYLLFEGSAGLSGDMILGALLDLGVSPSLFQEKMTKLQLPVKIQIQETKRAGLRGLRVDVCSQHKESQGRKWKDIESLIGNIPFSERVKKKSLAIFKRLFEAEAKVHGHSFEEAHLHEAGADDALIDIIGCCWLVEELQVTAFYATPLNVGEGWVKTSHGLLPVPPPAVGELLRRIPVYSAGVKEELVTPTGAAIISTLVEKFTSFPELVYEKIGYGAGSKNFPHFPNILRVFYGEKKVFDEEKSVYLVETTVDDSTPQILAHFIDQSFRLGALDAYLTAVVMKKNRLATKLTLLAPIDKIDVLIEAIFRETSSIGVRYFPIKRRVLERMTKKIPLFGNEVGIKISFLEGKEINVQPEYEDCLKVAEKMNIPLKEVIHKAIAEYFQKKEKDGSQKN